jgi:hypothetical protein
MHKDKSNVFITKIIITLKPEVEVLNTVLLQDFPSGSSINFHEGRLFLVGDDATHILILDANYQRLESIHLFDHTEKRIPKIDKTDLEGSAIVTINGIHNLLIVGSASRKNRKRIIVVPFSGSGLDFKAPTHLFIKTKTFVKRIKNIGIDEVNLEGVCVLNGDLILGNRGHRRSQNNHLIITNEDFWNHQEDAKLEVRKLTLPHNTAELLGLSELCYIASMDLLLVTLTSEDTNNAFDDGAIGNSFLGWVTNAGSKINAEAIPIEEILDLSTVAPALAQQKIEGICVESLHGRDAILHLIADNDTGESRLFKIKIRF